MNENIKVGTSGTIKVGRNEVKVKVIAKAPGGGWKVKTESGKEMTVKNITPNEQSAAKAATKETPKTDEGAKRPSLLNAAAAVLEQSDEPMSVRAMIESAKAKGLWSPSAGKTPEQTLYSAILREIKVKGEASRFLKSARGRFGYRQD